MKVNISDRDMALEERIKEVRRLKVASFKSRIGLSPDEIYFLAYAPKFKVGETQFQQFWLYDFAIDDPSGLLNKLMKMELIEPADIKSSLDKLKMPELKEILAELGEKTTGKKAELVSRVAQSASNEYLETKIHERYYQLTELGVKELEENNYVVYFGKGCKYGLDIWEMNRKIGNGNPKQYRDIIWGSLQQTNQKAMETLNNGDYREFLRLSIQNGLDQCNFILEEEKNSVYNVAFTSLALAVYYEYKFNAVLRYMDECELNKYDKEIIPKYEIYIGLDKFRYLKTTLNYSDEEMLSDLQGIFNKNAVDLSRLINKQFPTNIISNADLAGMIVEYSNGNDALCNSFLSMTQERLKIACRSIVSKPNKPIQYNSNKNFNTNNANTNNLIVFLLCLFLGIFGVHRFYMGQTKWGLIYLFTCGLFGIGWIIDCVMLFIKLF